LKTPVNIRYVLAVASLVQAHWLLLFYGIIIRESISNIRQTFTMFQVNSVIEVVFESVPQLYLQLYILLHGYIDADGKRGPNAQNFGAVSIQIATIIFSLLMAIKTLTEQQWQRSLFVRPGTHFGGNTEVSYLAKILTGTHTLGNVLGRALTIAVGATLSAAYQYMRLLGSEPTGGILFGWPLINIVGFMLGIRVAVATYRIYAGRKEITNRADTAYNFVTTLFTTMVRSYVADPVMEVIFILEGILLCLVIIILGIIITYCSSSWITRQLTDASYMVPGNFTNSTEIIIDAYDHYYNVTLNDTMLLNDTKAINRTASLSYNSVNFPQLSEVYGNMQLILYVGVSMIALHAASSVAIYYIRRVGWGLREKRWGS
jgi:hypothetical protein